MAVREDSHVDLFVRIGFAEVRFDEAAEARGLQGIQQPAHFLEVLTTHGGVEDSQIGAGVTQVSSGHHGPLGFGDVGRPAIRHYGRPVQIHFFELTPQISKFRAVSFERKKRQLVAGFVGDFECARGVFLVLAFARIVGWLLPKRQTGMGHTSIFDNAFQ